MLYSAQHHACVYDLQNPERILAVLPQARRVDQHRVAVPVTLHTMQVLRHLNFPVVNPMERDYDWPGQFRPMGHQRQAAMFHVLHPRCFNLSEMRTGKTMSVLWAADYLMRQGAIKRAVILAPLSTLHVVWEQEIFRHFLGRRTSVVVHGTRGERMDALREPHDFYIINHDGIKVGAPNTARVQLGPVARELLEREDLDYFALDEASAFKDPSSIRFRILQAIVKNKPYFQQLTGTPTPNAPTDAYGLWRLAGHPIWTGESGGSFKARTMLQVSNFKWIPKTEAPSIVHSVLQPAFRVARKDCMDLPPCSIIQREVQLSPTQAKAMTELKRDLTVQLESGGAIPVANQAALRMKLIQISCGAVYGENRSIHRTDASPRLAVLQEVLDEAGGNALLFAPLTSVVYMLQDWCNDNGYHAERVTGATSSTERTRIFRDLGVGTRVIVADPGTVKFGVDLSAANLIVWFGPTDKPEDYRQANERISGLNQKQDMTIVQLVSTPTEREIYRRLDEKESLQGAILQLVKG